jgi:hypothetical protein
MNPSYYVHTYTCPDCGHICTSPHGAHQHADGEWVYTDDIRRFYQWKRWLEKTTKIQAPEAVR